MDAKDAGTQALNDLAKEIEMLNTKNPCGWSEKEKHDVAKALKALISIKVNVAMSVEELANYLGVSCRTVRRRVQEGKLPKPKRFGHMEISYMLNEVDEYLEKNRESR